MRTRSIKTKALAYLTAALLTFGVAAPSMIPVSAAETATQQQDTRILENYLKGILPKDKSILLVDNGTGISMTTESEVTANGNGLLVIRRSKKTAEDQSANCRREERHARMLQPGLLHSYRRCQDSILPRHSTIVRSHFISY